MTSAISATPASPLVPAFDQLATTPLWQTPLAPPPSATMNASRGGPLSPTSNAEQHAPSAGPRRVGEIMPDVLARYGLRLPAPRPR